MKVTVTELKTNQWEPLFKTVTVLNEEEFNIFSNKLPEVAKDFKALKNNTYKRSRPDFSDRDTIEDVRAHHIRMLSYIGIKA